MQKVTVFFRASERDAASDTLRVQGVTQVQGGGFTFDSADYTRGGKWVTLTRGLNTYVVPTRNILLVKITHENGSTS